MIDSIVLVYPIMGTLTMIYLTFFTPFVNVSARNS